MPYLQIYQFAGLNTNQDARRIKPNKDTEGVAEAVEILNMDINREGAIVTSTGFELVSSIASTGGIKNLLNYDKNNDSRYLMITHGDHHYYITTASTVWQDSGDYGTAADLVGGTIYFGKGADRRAYLGSNVTANTMQELSVTGAMANVVGAPDGHIMATFMGRLFVAGDPAAPNTVRYCDVEDEDNFAGGGTIKFNDIVTGMWVEGARLIIFTRTYHQGVIFGFDDTFNLSTPQKEPYERRYGCLAYKTVQGIDSNVYYWSPRGVIRLGSEESYDDQGLPRPQSLSKNIEPTLESVNKANRAKATSVHWEEKQEYWLGVPYGTSTVVDTVFVYNATWDAWTVRNGFYPGDLEMFRSADYDNELYFGDANSPYLYKFNDEYSYDGAGYTRRWKSKIFNMGSGISYKRFSRIDITGSMDSGTSFDVILQMDNVKKRYRIDNTFLIRDSFGDYIGDNWYGDNWISGDSPAESRFKRFYAPLDFSKEVREGIELQITIENDGVEQPFKVDFIGIEYDILSRKQVPRRNYVNTQVTT